MRPLCATEAVVRPINGAACDAAATRAASVLLLRGSALLYLLSVH
jgi:hypothetical protein